MKHLLVLLLLTVKSGICFSQQPLHHVVHSHTVHSHGSADLALVYDSNRLYFELESPLANFLGFEHEPLTDQQRAEVQRISRLLQQPEELIELSPSCELVSIAIDFPFLEPGDDQTSENGFGKANVDHQEEARDDSHKDVKLSYQWLCASRIPPKIQIKLFEQFSGFEDISTQWIINGMQGSTPLNKNANSLKF
ncbi:ZrgA family zinc uptake protein [Aurantivibrio plasticivorans]